VQGRLPDEDAFYSGVWHGTSPRERRGKGGGATINNVFNIYADSTTNGSKLVRVIRAEFYQMVRQADRLAMR
jgi:hypothetical protein